jgi:hypothetical protein
MNWKNLELKQDELEKSCFDSDLIKIAKKCSFQRQNGCETPISTPKRLRDFHYFFQLATKNTRKMHFGDHF